MSPVLFDTVTEGRAAFDTLFATTQRELVMYDQDLDGYALDELARHTALRAFCVAGEGRRIMLLLDNVQRVVSHHPRLMQLVREFGHVLEIRLCNTDIPLPEQAFVISDHAGVLRRVDKSVTRGSMTLHDPLTARQLRQEFATHWQRGLAQVSATTLGL